MSLSNDPVRIAWLIVVADADPKQGPPAHAVETLRRAYRADRSAVRCCVTQLDELWSGGRPAPTLAQDLRAILGERSDALGHSLAALGDSDEPAVAPHGAWHGPLDGTVARALGGRDATDVEGALAIACLDEWLLAVARRAAVSPFVNLDVSMTLWDESPSIIAPGVLAVVHDRDTRWAVRIFAMLRAYDAVLFRALDPIDAQWLLRSRAEQGPAARAAERELVGLYAGEARRSADEDPLVLSWTDEDETRTAVAAAIRRYRTALPRSAGRGAAPAVVGTARLEPIERLDERIAQARRRGVLAARMALGAFRPLHAVLEAEARLSHDLAEIGDRHRGA